MAKNSIEISLKGLKKVMAAFDKEAAKLKNRSLQGNIKAAILIMNDTENTPPLTPLDTGNLRSSRFIVTADFVKMGRASNFIGKKAGDMKQDHISVIEDAKQIAKLSNRNKTVVFGFSANYALEVHSIEKNYKRPGSGTFYLKKSIDRNFRKALKIIGNETKIK